jgi:ABC-type uncharacterized transport system substrate-binding protein
MLFPSLRRLLLCLPLIFGVGEAWAKHCIYINAYHAGYDWSDRIQAQFEKDMQEQCRITVYHLDAKNTSHQQLSEKGHEIAQLIKASKPNVVIAADDASSEYVVQPHFRNAPTPIIYVGINWDPKPYGYPMDNATGMTEIWPTHEIFRILRHTVPQLNLLTIISADNKLEKIDGHHIEQIATKLGITVNHVSVSQFKDWKQAIINAQNADAIHLGTNQGIKDWSESEAITWLEKNNKRFTFASQDFMRPYVMFSLSKSPEEFGSWAAKLSQVIIAGTQPWQIPIVPNRQFMPYINPSLLSLTAYQLPAYIKRNAISYEAKPQP